MMTYVCTRHRVHRREDAAAQCRLSPFISTVTGINMRFGPGTLPENSRWTIRQVQKVRADLM